MEKQIIPEKEKQIRKKLRDKLWTNIEPSIEGYGDVIDAFCRKVDISTLEEIVRNL
jgi:hypothetical protein